MDTHNRIGLYGSYFMCMPGIGFTRPFARVSGARIAYRTASPWEVASASSCLMR